jgi:hypothetical protein
MYAKTRRDETRRDETRRDETRRDETRRDETIIRDLQLAECTIPGGPTSLFATALPVK